MAAYFSLEQFLFPAGIFLFLSLLLFSPPRAILFERNSHGVLAQLVARDIRIVEARGSTPLYSTKQKKSELDSYRKRARIFSLPELYTKTNMT